MVHLITGYAGKEHITSSDQGSFNAAVMGSGEFVLEGGEQFRCQVISNNKVRIFDGEALMQGRHIKIERNTYEETTHDNGTQGYQRIDLVVLTYTKNATTGIEGVTLDVIKGTPSASNPAVPEYETGDIINLGDLKNQMPLYKIPFDGLSIGEPVALFSTVPTLEGMKKEVDSKVEAKMDELDEKFAELEGSIEDKISEAGKPLSSNADDWALIEEYGEYSADAKTVGKEFKKVNDRLANGQISFGVVDGEPYIAVNGGTPRPFDSRHFIVKDGVVQNGHELTSPNGTTIEENYNDDGYLRLYKSGTTYCCAYLSVDVTDYDYLVITNPSVIVPSQCMYATIGDSYSAGEATNRASGATLNLKEYTGSKVISFISFFGSVTEIFADNIWLVKA